MKVLVIGGVAAGTKAAAKLKREDRGLDVALITKDQDISYAGCGLPYYVGGMIESRDELIVNTPEKYAALTGVRVLTGREAVELDSGKKLVTAKNLITGETEAYSYDRLVIATGASSAVPPIEGVGLKGVFKMRTPDDAIRIRDYVEAERVKKAVVIGGGFIGLEVAENLLAQGVDVTVMDFASQIMPNVLDPEMADYAQRHLRKQGVRVLTGTKAEKLVGDARVTAVKTASATLPAELVVLRGHPSQYGSFWLPAASRWRMAPLRWIPAENQSPRRICRRRLRSGDQPDHRPPPSGRLWAPPLTWRGVPWPRCWPARRKPIPAFWAPAWLSCRA